MSRWMIMAVLVLVTGCTTPTPEPAPTPDDGCCFEDGLGIADQYKVTAIETRRFTAAEYWAALEDILESPRLEREQIGESTQGRPLYAIHLGQGPVKVLAWSQMHGDESTASMALLDILNWIAADGGDPVRDRLLQGTSLTLVPVLNPDGAELFQRRNALGVDINRDARRQGTPEGRALKTIHDRIQPDFGFNLHDQSARIIAGAGGLQVGISLLAPAFNEDRDYDEVRSRARLVASRIASRIQTQIPGQVARYDDTFNPRAFGDLVQTWGTSTVLIESGALKGDPQKQKLRALNAAALIDTWIAIGEGTYTNAGPEHYENLPENRSVSFDLLVTGAQIVGAGPESYPLDIGILYDDAVAKTGPRVSDVGDLEASSALDTLDATGLFLHVDLSMLTHRSTNNWLQTGNPANFTLRRGSDPTSETVGSPIR